MRARWSRGLPTLALASLLLSAPALAQTQPVNPQAARQARPAVEAVLDEPTTTKPAAPLAAGRDRVLSKNEAYNRARAAEGRVGVRLGDDMSFRIGGN